MGGAAGIGLAGKSLTGLSPRLKIWEHRAASAKGGAVPMITDIKL
jgi:hypothetical protein